MALDISPALSGDTTTARALEDQRVVVVGGTSGMGSAAAQAVAAAGAHVTVAGRRAVADRPDLGIAPDQVAHATVDVTDEASVRALFESIGPLDHLLVTAAPAPGSWGPMLEQDLTAAREYLDAKFWGSWTCARYAAPKLPSGGSITFVTGCTAIRPRVGASIVTAAFTALEGLTGALARELGPIRVNTIRPGLVDSEMWTFLSADARAAIMAQTRELFPVKRVGAPEDIGHAALFLMTNPYVTGTTLEVAGGEPLVMLD
jgi:NAD(P)-dependent dehydrogenase (short-subunit alcohol dehydrogenase family)